MHQNSLVSIALCTYNGEIHLAEQIESILAQTYSNIELVIVDDFSADNTLAIARQFVAKDKRVKCFANSHNLGFNNNFQRALELTTGQFIAISDQDDIWEKDKIQKLTSAISDNWLIFSNSRCMTEAGQLTPNKLLGDFYFGNWDFRSLLIENFVTGHTCLMSRELLPQILPFPGKGYYDWWMGFIALYHHKLVYLDEELTRYRIHPASVTQTDIRKDEATFKVIDFNNVLTMMDNFVGYRQLAANDKMLIQKLRKAYAKRTERFYCMPLVALLTKYYHAIFPRLKKRGFYSRLNFALKYAKKL